MDLEEWELLPDEGFLQIHDDGGNQIYSRNYGTGRGPNGVLHLNYFICPPDSTSQLVQTTDLPTQLVPLPIPQAAQEPTVPRPLDHPHQLVRPVTQVPIEVRIKPSVPSPSQKMESLDAGDVDPVSQVHFKKILKENELVDIKVESPKSSNRGILPQMESFQFEDKGEAYKGEKCTAKVKASIQKKKMDMNEKEEEREEDGGVMNIWKWSINGIGAVCSFGVAAATVCIIILGSRGKGKQNQKQQLEFQIYANDEKMKQMMQRAKEAISAVRSSSGIAVSRAHITVGGYYDAV